VSPIGFHCPSLRAVEQAHTAPNHAAEPSAAIPPSTREAEVSAVIARIGDAPVSAATRTASSLMRKATIQRFPYVIAFEKYEQHVAHRRA
jgi:hypothetical protein